MNEAAMARFMEACDIVTKPGGPSPEELVAARDLAQQAVDMSGDEAYMLNFERTLGDWLENQSLVTDKEP